MKTKLSRMHAQVRTRVQTQVSRRAETTLKNGDANVSPAAKPAAPERSPAALIRKPLAARMFLDAAAAGWSWLAAKRRSQVASKRLRVIETVSLGEKRFAAVLHVDGAQFLIGGGANNVSLLASLDGSATQGVGGRFAQVLEQQVLQEPIV